jgi:hypothetical protein
MYIPMPLRPITAKSLNLMTARIKVTESGFEPAATRVSEPVSSVSTKSVVRAPWLRIPKFMTLLPVKPGPFLAPQKVLE